MENSKLRCRNAMNGKHKPIENARKTYYVCEYCRCLLDPILKVTKNA